MKIHQMKDGRMVAFGFDMVARKPDPQLICWNDPETGDWESGEAGSRRIGGMRLSPEFITERRNGLVAYQPGCAIEMNYLGSPLVWGIYLLGPQ